MNDEQISKALKVRAEFERVRAEVLATNDPQGADKLNHVAGEWLETENALDMDEYYEYQALWKAGHRS